MDSETEIKKLREENEKLTKLQSVRADMVSVGAHQIRTSLSAIKWIVKMFINGDVGELTAEQENLMKRAYEDNDRAIDIVSELLLANKTDELMEKKYNFSKVDVAELIDDAIFDFSGEAHAGDIEVIFLKPKEKLPNIKADKEKLLVVLQNLLENAIKYSDPHQKVFIALREKNGLVEVSIKNTGVMISEEGRNKIFQKFYRDPEAEKKGVIGSGIGLFTAQQIIEGHGGKIWFENEGTKDTTFLFTIPNSPSVK